MYEQLGGGHAVFTKMFICWSKIVEGSLQNGHCRCSTGSTFEKLYYQTAAAADDDDATHTHLESCKGVHARAYSEILVTLLDNLCIKLAICLYYTVGFCSHAFLSKWQTGVSSG